MGRFSGLVACAAAAVLFAGVLPQHASAHEPEAGTVELMLGGSGSSDKDFDSTNAAINGSIGLFVSPNIELSLRQNVNFLNNDDDNFWNGSTRGAVDFQFNFGRFAPFIGANIGYVYGDFVADTWAAAPEAGIKLYIGPSGEAFLYGMVEYQFFFDEGDEADDSFDDGSFVYSIGIGAQLN